MERRGWRGEGQGSKEQSRGQGLGGVLIDESTTPAIGMSRAFRQRLKACKIDHKSRDLAVRVPLEIPIIMFCTYNVHTYIIHTRYLGTQHAKLPPQPSWKEPLRAVIGPSDAIVGRFPKFRSPISRWAFDVDLGYACTSNFNFNSSTLYV